MKIGLISDIHGNLEALKTALTFLRERSNKIICLGDIIGYGPNPVECLEIVFGTCGDDIIFGNHEHGVIGEDDLDYYNPIAKKAVLWTRDQLSEEWLKRLRVGGYRLHFEELDFVIAHGSLHEPIDEYLIHPGNCTSHFKKQDESVCFVGHTHMPVIFTHQRIEDIPEIKTLPFVAGQPVVLGGDVKYTVNPGSVGQPRDNDPRLSVGIFDTETREYTNHRMEYNFVETQKKIIEAGLPKELAARLSLGN
ncbi:MAG: metallophosphoesterase family protein [Candidatus Lindowbacteria bacterium]|nr:metallophosphoesterase family protein [Candidatus Lindowbacteria bacterium]